MTLDSCEFIDIKISTILNGGHLIRLQIGFCRFCGNRKWFQREPTSARTNLAVPRSKTLHESFNSVGYQLRNNKNSMARFTFARAQIHIRKSSTNSQSASQYFQRIFIEYCYPWWAIKMALDSCEFIDMKISTNLNWGHFDQAPSRVFSILWEPEVVSAGTN